MSTIDSITRSVLFDMGLSMHYYVYALNHGLTCLHELHQDTLQVTKKTRLTVNAFSEITLPTDFENVVGVYAEMSQYLIPYLINPILTSLPNLDGTTQIPYTPPPNTEIEETNWGLAYYYNDNGEFLGRNFGGKGSRGGGFNVIRERNVIFLGNLTPAGTVIVLEYLPKAQATTSGDPITSYEYWINDYAVETIRAYITWKMSRTGNRLVVQNLQQVYANAHRILRGRMNELDGTAIKDIITMKRRFAPK